jgi:surfeit locus 1 family protein
VQLPERQYFTPDNAPAQNAWYWADIPAMAAAAGFQGVPDMLVVLPPSGDVASYPLGVAVAANIPNNHLQYAVFWFGMGFVLLAVYGLSLRRKETP